MFHIYNRFSVIILSGELTKFHMFPKGETLHCLKVSNFAVCAILRGDRSKEIAKHEFQLFNGIPRPFRMARTAL